MDKVTNVMRCVEEALLRLQVVRTDSLLFFLPSSIPPFLLSLHKHSLLPSSSRICASLDTSLRSHPHLRITFYSMRCPTSRPRSTTRAPTTHFSAKWPGHPHRHRVLDRLINAAQPPTSDPDPTPFPAFRAWNADETPPPHPWIPHGRYPQPSSLPQSLLRQAYSKPKVVPFSVLACDYLPPILSMRPTLGASVLMLTTRSSARARAQTSTLSMTSCHPSLTRHPPNLPLNK